ncbi:MAG: hypothetical protein SGCHY_002496 [Lobulomycetales sp.]
MLSRFLCIFLYFAVAPIKGAFRGFNGLSQTPAMGWNTWNAFECNINESLIMQTADRIIANGLDKLGYTYLNIDDCWQWEGGRDADDLLVADPEKFPSGIAALSNYVHNLGLKIGIYSDAGKFTCAGFPGSYGYEDKDAQLFASWGIDYLKYDNCYAAGHEGSLELSYERFKRMSDAILETKRPIVFSICNWGQDRSWFDRDDDRCPCDSILDCKLPGLKCSAAKIIEFAAQVSAVSAGPGRWMDMDMLEVGNGGMTTEEYRTHFTFWCALKSPLILGNDLRSEISQETRVIITNPNLIAINQDPLGKPVMRRFKRKDGMQVWAGEISGGFVVIIYNRDTQPHDISVPFEEIFLDDLETNWHKGKTLEEY